MTTTLKSPHDLYRMVFRVHIIKIFLVAIVVMLLGVPRVNGEVFIKVSPAGEPVPGGRIVPMGTVLKFTFFNNEGDWNYNLLGNIPNFYRGGNRHTGDPETSFTQGTGFAHILNEKMTVIRLTGYLTVDDREQMDKPIPGERVLASEDIWVFSNLAPFPGAVEVLNPENVSKDGKLRYRVNLSNEILSAGGRGNSYDPDRFWLNLARLGGTLENGVKIAERGLDVARPGIGGLVAGVQEGTTSISEPGIYELRLQIGGRGIIYSSARFEIKPKVSKRDPDVTVPLDQGLTRVARLLAGPVYRMGDQIHVGVEWVKDDPASPDLPEYYQYQYLRIDDPGSTYEGCVTGTQDLSGRDVKMKLEAPGRFTTTINASDLRPGSYHLAVLGQNDNRKSNTPYSPIEQQILEFEILPPDSKGLLTYTKTANPTLSGGYYFHVSLNGPLPANLKGFTTVEAFLVPEQTPAGAILPGTVISQGSITNGQTTRLSVNNPRRDFEIRLVGSYYCGNGSCDRVILDSITIPGYDDTIPEEIRRRVRLDPTALNVVQPWPRLRSDPMVLCGPVEKLIADYQPPPWLAFEVASFPRQPQPGLPLTVVFRIENKSDLPAAAVKVELALVNPWRERPLKDLEVLGDFCEAVDVDSFRCYLGDMDPGQTADLVFDAETPMTGTVIWTANLKSAGDLGGVIEYGGVIGRRAPPRIVEVVVMANQTRVENEVPIYPYPFGPNSRGRHSRYLLVVGHNLPYRSAQQWPLPDTKTINYAFLAYQDTTNSVYQELFASGWMQFYDMKDAAAAINKADEDGYEALLIRADLLEGVMPGQQTITVSSAEGHWGLEFGDVSARISFVRVRGLPRNNFDLLKTAYFPERIRLAVETNMRLPIEEIPVFINSEGLGAGQTEETSLVATRSTLANGRIYLTPPLDLHELGKSAALPGGLSLAVKPKGKNTNQLKARIDKHFIFEKFRLPIDPLVAEVAIARTPAQGKNSWLWRDALTRVARCHNPIIQNRIFNYIQIENWDTLPHEESEEIWNLMILTTSDHFPGQSVLFGHHAGAILLRDMFLVVMEQQIKKLEQIRNNRDALRGMLAYMKPRRWDDTMLLLRMKVADFGGGEIEYRYVINNDWEWLAEQNDTTEAAILAWQIRETRAAIDKLLEAAREAIKVSKDAGDCKVEDLIRLTGFNFQSVGQLTKAEMVTLSEITVGNGPKTLIWQPDITDRLWGARTWIDRIAPLAAAVREQERRAGEDTDMTLALVGFATLPFMLTGNTMVVLVLFTVDLVDLGVTTVHELSQYFDSEAELEFALGASIQIGSERYETAQKNAKGWASTAFGIGTSAFGAVAGGFDALPRLVALRRVARGRHLAEALEGIEQIKSLRPVDLQDFGAFVISARMRSQSLGVKKLTAIERRALDLVDEYRTALSGTRILNEPDLPPANLVDSFTPSSPVRFDVDPESGFGTARPPAGGRIETPRASGDVPNALEARVPEDAHVRFKTPGGDDHELPLGRRLGEGSTSEVFEHADDPNLAIRITYLRENANAVALDDFGRRALETGVQSEFIRAVREIERFDVASGKFRGGKVTRVTVVEKVQETAKKTIARQGGKMSVAQIMAYEGALRHLNRKGLVWLDNKWDNFAFVPKGDGSGRVEVVVMDTGGIVPVRANMDIPAPTLARDIQLIVNGEFTGQVPDFRRIKTPKLRSPLRKDKIKSDFADAFDYDALDIPDIEQLAFNPISGEHFPYISEFFEIYE